MVERVKVAPPAYLRRLFVHTKYCVEVISGRDDKPMRACIVIICF